MKRVLLPICAAVTGLAVCAGPALAGVEPSPFLPILDWFFRIILGG